jgi:peptidoglycan/xylan/chitin deacetylase (PgdA/CDA1 family)
MGLMGTTNELGEQFGYEDLHSAAARGHELANHSFSHFSARRTSLKEFMGDVDRCEREIRETIAVNLSNNFAYPYGDVTSIVKMKLGSRMGSCRGTYDGLNGPDVDLNLLRANRLYGGHGQVDAARRLVLENERRKSWLIFYSHDVSSTPSRFGCTTGMLEDVVSFAAQHSVGILPVRDVMGKICSAVEARNLRVANE